MLWLPWLPANFDGDVYKMSTESTSTYFRWAIIGKNAFFGSKLTVTFPVTLAKLVGKSVRWVDSPL